MKIFECPDKEPVDKGEPLQGYSRRMKGQNGSGNMSGVMCMEGNKLDEYCTESPT